MNFNFWKENKVANHFLLSAGQLAMKFEDWLTKQNKDYLEYYRAERIIRNFLTAEDGLNSVINEAEYDAIHNHLSGYISKQINK